MILGKKQFYKSIESIYEFVNHGIFFSDFKGCDHFTVYVALGRPAGTILFQIPGHSDPQPNFGKTLVPPVLCRSQNDCQPCPVLWYYPPILLNLPTNIYSLFYFLKIKVVGMRVANNIMQFPVDNFMICHLPIDCVPTIQSPIFHHHIFDCLYPLGTTILLSVPMRVCLFFFCSFVHLLLSVLYPT